MDWIMTKQVKQAAKDGEIPAMECSLAHHKQGAECTRGELIDAMDKGLFSLHAYFCACCEQWAESKFLCGKCPLVDIKNQQMCCGGVFRPANDALKVFQTTLRTDDFTAFQDAEKKVCDYIQAVIDKAKKERVGKTEKPKAEDKVKLDYSKPIIATGGTEPYILMPTYHSGTYRIAGYDWLRLSDWKANSCHCWKTPQEAVTCYSMYTLANIDLAAIFDDLTEKLDGFEMEQKNHPLIEVSQGTRILKQGHCVHINQVGEAVLVGFDQLDEFISKLQQVRNGIRSQQ